MGKKLDEALAEADEIEAAEADQTDRPIPPHVKVSRPNRSRSRVLQVRLNPDEMEALERIAERRELPVSTVAREQLLRLLTEDGADTASRASEVAATLMLVANQVQDLLSEIDSGIATIKERKSAAPY
ncbi:hypothetical protein [Mycobacterium sp. NPDC050041]|uniref:hypothetical protein n=1 Tax=Mycobacterium sp. NPDC050041 TaxID=3364293 RepID=UPI003C2CC62B